MGDLTRFMLAGALATASVAGSSGPQGVPSDPGHVQVVTPDPGASRVPIYFADGFSFLRQEQPPQPLEWWEDVMGPLETPEGGSIVAQQRSIPVAEKMGQYQGVQFQLFIFGAGENGELTMIPFAQALSTEETGHRPDGSSIELQPLGSGMGQMLMAFAAYSATHLKQPPFGNNDYHGFFTDEPIDMDGSGLVMRQALDSARNVVTSELVEFQRGSKTGTYAVSGMRFETTPNGFNVSYALMFQDSEGRFELFKVAAEYDKDGLGTGPIDAPQIASQAVGIPLSPRFIEFIRWHWTSPTAPLGFFGGSSTATYFEQVLRDFNNVQPEQ